MKIHQAKTLCKALFIIILACPIAACGIKPGHVDSPSGEEKDYFPRKYPDVATDPAPAASTYTTPSKTGQ